MKLFTLRLIVSLFLAVVAFAPATQGQSILNPADTIVTYNPAAPPTQPTYGQIGKWVRTVRLGWNTSGYKCYIYKGIPFRLYFPKTYNPTANDGKKYPMLIFYHGVGEASSTPYDNEYQLYHGGQIFANAVANGVFDGYVIAMQTGGGWGTTNYTQLKEIIDYMVTNNKLDAFHIVGNGLSGGGSGTWSMFLTYPTYNAGIMPMSAIDVSYAQSATVNVAKFTPIWNLHGGLDGSPAPSTCQQVTAAMAAAGANYVDKNYTTLGHDVWDSTWQEPNFWPFANAAYAANPWTLFGRTQFCPGDSINVTMGVAPGFNAYEWRKNDTIISGATTNSINVRSVGRYDVRVLRGTIWSDRSHIPAVISIKAPTVTPPITVSGLMSDVIPAADGNNFVNLQVPDSGYTSYTWEKVGNNTVLGTQRIFKATTPGNYIVSVTQPFGCSSNFSPPFTVINAAGSNPPSPASNLVANTLSFTQVELDWSRNPNPTFPETGFEIYRSLTAGGPYTFIGQVPYDTVRYIDQGLTPNVKYYYVVRAIDNTAAAALSNEALATTQSDKTPPTAPGNLRVVSSSTSTITIAWDSASDNVAVKNYVIYVNGVRSYTTTQKSFIVTGLQPSQQFTIYVVAVDGSNNVSTNSNQVSAASVSNGFAYNYYTTPTGWSVLPNFNTLTPTLSGTMPNVSIANATQTINYGYVWQGYINVPVAGTYTFATSSDDGSALWFNSYTATGTPTVNNDGLHGTVQKTSAALNLQPGVYPICIEFFQNGGGAAMGVSWACSSLFGDNNQHTITDNYFASTFNPGGTAPAAPTAIKATAVSYNKVNLTWTDNSTNETGFEIFRSTGFGAAYSIVATAGANATSFTDSTAQAATTYYYKVQAINKYGSSGFDPASMGGISYSFYNNFTYNNLSNLPLLTPAFTGSLTNISLSPANVTTNYAFKYQGTINIPTTGSYTFYTSSDDGSDMYIGGFDSAHLVVKNDFLQGPTERASAPMTLNKGSYPLYVTYFQQGGGVALTASYQGPGISKQNIPDSAFVNVNAQATTFALPATPSVPYNVAVATLSPSSLKVSWQDSSATVTGYQISRSSSDSLHFVLLKTITGNTVNYTDTALFSNLAYYYKVSAIGTGGNSVYSLAVRGITGNNLPVINKLANQSARYGTTTVIPVSATSTNSGTLVFTASNLPAFASFVDNGNRTASLTLNPAVTDQGNYTNLRIVVSDAFGGADTTTFSLNVNNNYTPVIDTIPSYTINENDTLSITLNAHNQNTADTLTLSVNNVPTGYTLTPLSNGVARLLLHPGYAGAGVYNVQVTANDNNGLSATRSFVVTVKDKDPNTKIYTRYGNTDAIGAPWNTITAATTTGLRDGNGVLTTAGVTLAPTSWWNAFNGGPTTGNNSGVYPDPVLLDYYYFGIFGGPDSVNGTVTGLDTSKLYNLTFFASSVWNGVADNGNTTFGSGSQKVSLYVQNNRQNTVSLNNLKPAANGTIPFMMGKAANASVGYLNSLVITKLYDDGSAPAGVGSLTATRSAGKVQLNWVDSAFNATGYEVWRALSATGSYTLLGTVSGNSANSYTDSLVTGNTSYNYEVRAVNTHGQSGFTVVAVTTLNRLPKINAIANISLRNTQQLTVNVTTVDDSTAHLRLTASNLPAFASFTDNGNGTGVITISPSAGTVGVFPNATITVKDALDSAASTSFTIAVTEPNVSSVYVNFSDGTNPAPKPWNTMAGPPFSGTVLSNLVDDSNNPTTMSLALTNGFQWVIAAGMQPYNGHSVYPDVVLRTAYYESTTTVRTIKVSGLSATKRYNFVFFGSHDDGLSGLTNYSIGGQTVSLQTTHNINKTVQINNVKADVSGSVTISVAKGTGASNAFINTLVIQSYDSATAGMLNPADLRIIDIKRKSITLQWQDRGYNETGFEVWRANDSTSSAYKKIATMGANVTTYKDTTVAQNQTYYYLVRAVNSTTSTTSGYSNPVSGSTYDYVVYINFTATNEAPLPWNNLNGGQPQLGYTWYNFLDETNALTSVGMQVTSNWSGLYGAGQSTGNNSGIYPDNVLLDSYGLFPGVTGTLLVSGLDQSKVYDFTFLGSSQAYGDVNTAYTMNGKTTILNTSLNINGTTTLYGIVPDANGNVNLSVAPADINSQFGLINALLVQGYSLSANRTGAPSLPTGTVASPNILSARGAVLDNSASTIGQQDLGAYPNPFQQFFTLSIPAANGDRVQVSIYDAGGRQLLVKEYDNLVEGNNYLRIDATSGMAAHGLYIVRVAYAGKGTVKTFKLIKE